MAVLPLWLIFLVCYLSFIVIFMVIPASLGFSFGIRNLYLATLYNVFEFGRKTIQSKQGMKSNVIDKTPAKPTKGNLPRNRSFGTFQREFHMGDAVEFCVNGVEAIIDDEVTKCFSAEELVSWNFLTRTNENYHYISVKLTIMWIVGCFIRYVILFPMRLTVFLIGMTILITSRIFIAQLPKSSFRNWLDTKLMLISFRIFARAVSAVITFHNKENMAKGGGICVANHTTPLDVLILMCDRCYSLVGQRQPGLFGFFEKTLAKTQDHIWFERTEMKDRLIVTKRLREHVEDASKNPILIFPEGTCINNTSVMMFKKGSFEISGDIYPVAIKYDPTFGNAFWNSSTEGFALYLFLLLTNWALVCDVWYLPRMTRLEDETAVQFANRVKTEIARQGGLVDLIWDGQLKRTSVKPEFRQRRQEDYASTLKVD
ncbi:glycerol-3-phosphate acyltransferase 3-like isoform X1 [Porites lutea]|uniref:glycerol-3-phosphate acyltransferase 3-like isoform X1 n=2 Tax=Porites lutea TaxID=51062 RepID=UPI003CC6A2A3